MKNLATLLLILVRRDLRAAFKNCADIFYPLMFFILAGILFMLASGGVGVTTAVPAIWMMMLLAVLLACEAMYRRDYSDGKLEQILLSHHPLAVLVLAHLIAHWLVAGLPLVVVVPIYALAFGIPAHALPELLLGLLLAVPTLILIGGVGVALTRAARARSALLAILILPLYIPVLIFGSEATRLAATGLSADAQLFLLGAGLLFALALAPLAMAAALRATYE